MTLDKKAKVRPTDLFWSMLERLAYDAHFRATHRLFQLGNVADESWRFWYAGPLLNLTEIYMPGPSVHVRTLVTLGSSM